MRNAINDHVSDWPRPARIVNDVGKLLQSQLGDEPIPGHRIRRQAERIGGYSRDSILRSDYCYSRVNASPVSFRYPIFEYVRRGQCVVPVCFFQMSGWLTNLEVQEGEEGALDARPDGCAPQGSDH